MIFENAKHVRDLIWWEGPLLSLYELEGKSYLVYWVDVEEKHVWLIIEVSREDLGLYLAGQVNLYYLQEKSPSLQELSGTFKDGTLMATTFASLRDAWKAPTTSFFDATLTYEYQYPNE